MSEATQLEGFKELDSALKKLPGFVAQKLLDKATRSGATVVRREARKIVLKKTGNVRKNIGVRRKRGSRIPTSVTYSIGWLSDGFYGRFLELGTRYVPAKPHLRPAFEANKREIMEKIRFILWRGILRETKKYLK